MSAIASTGMMMRLAPKTPYDFGRIQGGQSQTIYVAQHIDVGPFQEADLMIRVHSVTIGTGASITVQPFADGWTLEDPATIFAHVQDAAGVTYGSFTLNNATIAPSYAVLPLARPFARMITVALIATQSTSPGSCTANLSIDLSLKGGSPQGLRMAYNTYRGYRI